MSSVLAIVSKALFEKMVPKDVKLGSVVDTNQYTSSNKAFDGLKEGGAIFLVTVRPPDEKLWLVGVLENPKKKGDAWQSKENEVALTDVTSAIPKLVFQSGTGIKAKKGALGMSLQTPRVLTDADVKILRALASKSPAKKGAKVHENEAYKKAVDAVVHKPKKTVKLGKFRLENHRRPFDGKKTDLAAYESAQLKAVVGAKQFEALFGAGGGDEEGEEMKELEVADVIDTETGKPAYQLMIWPYGDGSIFHAGTTDCAVAICQHGLDPIEEIGKAWIRDFGRAWVEGSKRLKMWTGHIDISSEELAEDADDDD